MFVVCDMRVLLIHTLVHDVAGRDPNDQHDLEHVFLGYGLDLYIPTYQGMYIPGI